MAVLTAGFALTRGDEPALIDADGTTTWAELDVRVNQLVAAFRAAGLQPGETIAVVVANRREWFELAQACAHGGWTYVPVNWHWVADELAYVLADASAAVVVVDARYESQVGEALAAAGATGVRMVVGIGEHDGAVAAHPRFVAYEAFVASGDPAEPADQRLGGPMFYTSGTTGRPKGVRGALAGGGAATPELMQLVAGGFKNWMPIPGRTMLCGPVYHSAQWAFSFLPMVAGSSVIIQHKFDAEEMLTLIDRHQATNVHLVPTQMKRLLDLPEEVRDRFDGSSLSAVWHGAAPCPPTVKRGLIEWWGPKITEYYGSTEGSIISTIGSQEWLERGGSVGKPLPLFDVLVVDEGGAIQATGGEGTLYFRNKMGTDFSYHNDDAKTASAHLEPGVFTTGDVGYLDDEGYLWLSDRRIDMIISGGVNIYPAEIEGALSSHPAVADVAVIGVPDEEYGESVKAVVQVNDGIVADDALVADLIGHCRRLLAGYKAPKSVDFVAELPRTATGKLQKQPLRAPYWAGHDRRI